MTIFQGHDQQCQQLEQHLRQRRLAHTYVFYGPQGVGKRTLAERFIHAFLKGSCTLERKTPDDGLWARMQAGTHGNIRKIHPPLLETGKQSLDVSIDEIRKGMDVFMQCAFEPGGRVMMIDSCDQLTRQAANSLLKVLEEPPRDCLIILINHRPARLLPTLRSRAHQITFSPLSAAILSDLSMRHGWNPDFIPLALGAPGTLQRLSNVFSPLFFQLFQKSVNDLVHDKFDGAGAFIEELLHQTEKNEDILEAACLLITGWFAQQISLKAKGKDSHPLYAKYPLAVLLRRWVPLQALFHEASAFYMDIKQTLFLGLKLLDPAFPIPFSALQPWQPQLG